MLLYKNNKNYLPLNIETDEIIERFCTSTFINDARRELKVRLALFIASSEGYESTVAKRKEFNQLVKRYNLTYHKYKERIASPLERGTEGVCK